MGKAVQHFCIFAELLDSQTVIFLIQEKSCFLSVFYIYLIFYPILFDFYQSRKFRTDKALVKLHSLLTSYLGIASLVNSSDSNTVLFQNLFQKFQYLQLQAVNSQGKRLNNKHIRKFVNNKSGKKISFSENQSAASCICYLFPVFPGISYSLLKEFLINLLVFIPCEQPHCDFGVGINKSSAQRISVKISYQNNISIEKASHHRSYLVVKHPHSAGFQETSFPFFQRYYCQTHVFFSFRKHISTVFVSISIYCSTHSLNFPVFPLRHKIITFYEG